MYDLKEEIKRSENYKILGNLLSFIENTGNLKDYVPDWVYEDYENPSDHCDIEYGIMECHECIKKGLGFDICNDDYEDDEEY